MPESCPRKWQTGCPRRQTKEGCFRVVHHLLYPASDYKPGLEQDFRNLPANTVNMCKHVEEEIHRLQPEGPPKPTLEVMTYCVEQERLKRQLMEEAP